MITEDYVSFETAKLLKEKGFNIPYDSFRGVYINGEFKRLNPGAGFGYNFGDEIVEVCSLQTAMKWLRKVHNQIIVPNIRAEDPISGTINCYIVGIWYIPKNNGGSLCFISPTPENGYSTYEQACEAAIKYCLENLI